MHRNFARLIGFAFWAICLTALWYGWSRLQPPPDADDAATVSLSDYFSGPVDTLEFSGPQIPLQADDPIFVDLKAIGLRPVDTDSAKSDWRQVGYVKSVRQSADQQTASVVWYSRTVPPSGFQLTHHRTTGRIEEVLSTLFPESKQAEIKHRISSAMAQHGDELTAAFVPLVRQTISESMPVIERGVKESLRRHRGEIDQLAIRLQNEVVSKRLVPLAKREIVPIVRKHAEEPASDIGRELWDRASIWRFGWRALYDKSPLPNKKLVREEWDRFVEEEATPIFEAHMDDIVASVQRTVTDIAANQTIRREVSAVADDVAADPEAQEIVKSVLKEALVENEELREVWRQVWTTDKAREALEIAGDRVEPIVRAIGDDIFGSRDQGINPDFARVLRNQILGKDRSWIVAKRIETDGVILSTKPGRSMAYPVVYLAANRDKNATQNDANRDSKRPGPTNE